MMALVIAETFTSMQNEGKPLDAAVNGVLEVTPSIISAITTTIIALAFFFLDGFSSKIMSDIAVVVIIIVIVSLVEGFLFYQPIWFMQMYLNHLNLTLLNKN